MFQLKGDQTEQKPMIQIICQPTGITNEHWCNARQKDTEVNAVEASACPVSSSDAQMKFLPQIPCR